MVHGQRDSQYLMKLYRSRVYGFYYYNPLFHKYNQLCPTDIKSVNDIRISFRFLRA